ncbi:hypothetical protein TPHV1_50101 [Treponema phagedenis]|uniref:Uncharacterized protein n=1 Tax=Treponema phagedenis TaxID=162 RepID=A0A0B7H1K2_TREPH|nr:hypothetical protein TPHV1_50101 [Treponema phagedenis]
MPWTEKLHRLAGEVKARMSTLRPCCCAGLFRLMLRRDSDPLTPAAEECKFQNGHGRPWFQTETMF